MADSKDNKNNIEDEGKERMEIENDHSNNNENKVIQYNPNILFSNQIEMELEELENIQFQQMGNNFRFNKFYNQSQFLPLSQSKTHSGLPSDLNKIYYKKMTTPSFFCFLLFFIHRKYNLKKFSMIMTKINHI